MQHKSKNTLDSQVKDALNSLKPPYREDLWKGIEAQLPAQKKPVGWYKWSIAAMLLLSAGGGSFYLLNKPEKQGLTQQIKVSAKSGSGNTIIENNPVAVPKPGDASAYIHASENDKVNTKNKAINTTKRIKNNTNADKRNISAVIISEKEKSESKHQENLLAEENKNITNIPAENFLRHIEIAINKVINAQAEEPETLERYAEKTKNIKPGRRAAESRPNGKLATYAFWNNAAYTGEQGTLNLSFDDKITYLEGKSYSEAKNNFGAEVSIPKSRFAVGIYHQRQLKRFSLKTNTGFSASARLFNIGNGYLKAGAGISQLSSKIFKNSLSYSDQIDARAGFVYTTRERDFTSVQNTYGADAGIWYASPRLMGGISVKNINEPQFGRIESGEKLNSECEMAAGYTIPVKDFSILPWIELKSTTINRQASGMLLVSYKNMITIGAAYQNISQENYRGNVMAFASIEIKNRLRLYGMYGQNTEIQRLNINQNIIQSGIRFQLP